MGGCAACGHCRAGEQGSIPSMDDPARPRRLVEYQLVIPHIFVVSLHSLGHALSLERCLVDDTIDDTRKH
jgi:hypothetical protein